MKVKKRLTWIPVVLVAVILITGLAIFGITEYQSYTDSRDNQYLLNISVDSIASSTGQDSPVSFTVSNDSYIPVQIREVMLLSVYDQAGNPVFLDGSPYTDSSVELRSEGTSLAKALEDHQAVYVREYSLDAGKPLFEARSEWEDSGNSTTRSNYSLVTAADSPEYILRLDLFLYGRPQAYAYADWQSLCSISNISEGAFTDSISLPVFSATQSYHWELDSGKALLVDAGNMQDPDIVIPEKIWLTETPDGYVEDPVTGTCYDVKVKGNAFYENKWLQTVTFQDEVSVAGNIMWDGRKQGMFEGCTALTAVNNIPDGVISMEETFQRCSSLQNMPQLPKTVENLSGCFLNCAALQEISSIPTGVTSVTNCFQGCASLKETPAFPEGVTDLSGCFSGCTALETVAPLPKSVTVLDRAFAGCSNLTAAPILPDGLKSMAATFYGCAKLTEIKNLPDSVVNLASCFKQCSSLETLPELPSQAFILDECFYGCTNLTGSITLPGDAFAYSDYLNILPTRLFDGCESLEAIFVDGCPNVLKEDLLDSHIPVRFTKAHTRGTCESCHIYSDTLAVNGLTVVMEEVPEVLLPVFMEILEGVHEDLIPTCRRLTFTSNWNHAEWSAGFYYWDSRNAYIRIFPFPEFYKIDVNADITDLQSALEAVAEKYISINGNYSSVVIHELAHGYDRHSSGSFLSDTARWRELYAQEGEQFNPDSALYASNEYRREAFAKTVAQYFTDAEALQSSAPGIYAYIDERFGEAA